MPAPSTCRQRQAPKMPHMPQQPAPKMPQQRAPQNHSSHHLMPQQQAPQKTTAAGTQDTPATDAALSCADRGRGATGSQGRSCSRSWCLSLQVGVPHVPTGSGRHQIEENLGRAAAEATFRPPSRAASFDPFHFMAHKLITKFCGTKKCFLPI